MKAAVLLFVMVVVSVSMLMDCCEAKLQGQQENSVEWVDDAETSPMMLTLETFSRDLKHRKRRRKRRKRGPPQEETPEPEICDLVREANRNTGNLGQCLEENARNLTDSDQCAQHDLIEDYNERREACISDNKCQFFGPPGTPKHKHQCRKNICFRINNNMCNIQSTGGRCVWWTREQNRRYHGISSPACRVSPCAHPIDNTPNGCVKDNFVIPYKKRKWPDAEDYVEPSPYQCVYCKNFGCVNAKMTSTAQCYNIGAADYKGCSSCNQAPGRPCSKKCRQQCCGNELFCKCMNLNP